MPGKRNSAPAIGACGSILAVDDESDLAIKTINDAIRRSSRDGFMPIWLMGFYLTYHTLQNYEQAATAALRAVRVAPDNHASRWQSAAAYFMLNRLGECQAELDIYFKLDPGATLVNSHHIPARNQQHLDYYIEILRQAGVSESA